MSVSDQGSGGGTGNDQPVQVDWSQLPITQSLVQNPPNDAGALFAMLGVDPSQQSEQTA